ncbi:hypothetical protein FRC11_005723, partial [Ceratobasidium sp. 423]
MSLHNRKRIRTNNRSSNNSSTSLASQSSGETANAPAPTTTQNQPPQHFIFFQRFRKIALDFCDLHTSPVALEMLNSPCPTDIVNCYKGIVNVLQIVARNSPVLQEHEEFYNLTCSNNRVDASTSTEPPPAPPTYNNVACMADTAPTPSAQPPVSSPSPKPGPRPPRPPCPKKAQPLTPRPRPHQVRSNVRLVACIAGRADAVTSKTLHWKE